MARPKAFSGGLEGKSQVVMGTTKQSTELMVGFG